MKRALQVNKRHREEDGGQNLQRREHKGLLWDG